MSQFCPGLRKLENLVRWETAAGGALGSAEKGGAEERSGFRRVRGGRNTLCCVLCVLVLCGSLLSVVCSSRTSCKYVCQGVGPKDKPHTKRPIGEQRRERVTHSKGLKA